MKNFTRFLAMTLAVLFAVGTISISAKTYSDVTSDTLYAKEINVVTDLGIIEGIKGGLYNGSGKVSRAVFTMFAAKAMTGYTDETIWSLNDETTTFTDLNSRTYPAAVAWGVHNGLIRGRSDTEFDPSTTITLAEASAILVRALGYDYEVTYTLGGDAWKWAYLYEAMQLGIIKGLETSSIAVDHPVTRAEAALLIYNTLFITRRNGNTIIDKVWGGLQETSTAQLVIAAVKDGDERDQLLRQYGLTSFDGVKLYGFVDGKVVQDTVIYLTSDQFEEYTGYTVDDVFEKTLVGSSIDVVYAADGVNIESMSVNPPKNFSGIVMGNETDAEAETVTINGVTYDASETLIYVTYESIQGYPVSYPGGVYKTSTMSHVNDQSTWYIGVDGELIPDIAGGSFYLDEDNNIIIEKVADVNSVAFDGVITSGQYGKFSAASENYAAWYNWDATDEVIDFAQGTYRHATAADYAKVAIVDSGYKPSRANETVTFRDVVDELARGSYTAQAFDDDGDGVADRLFLTGTRYEGFIGYVNEVDGVIHIIGFNNAGAVEWIPVDEIDSINVDGVANTIAQLAASSENRFFYGEIALTSEENDVDLESYLDGTGDAEIEEVNFIEWIPFQFGVIDHLAELVNPSHDFSDTAAVIGITLKGSADTVEYFADIDPIATAANNNGEWAYYWNNFPMTNYMIDFLAETGYNQAPDTSLEDRDWLVTKWVKFVSIPVNDFEEEMIIYVEESNEPGITNAIYMYSSKTDIGNASFVVWDFDTNSKVTVEPVDLFATIANNIDLVWFSNLKSNLWLPSADGNFAYVNDPEAAAVAEYVGAIQLWAGPTDDVDHAPNLLYLSFQKDNIGEFYTVEPGESPLWTDTNRTGEVETYLLNANLWYYINTEEDSALNEYWFEEGDELTQADYDAIIWLGDTLESTYGDHYDEAVVWNFPSEEGYFDAVHTPVRDFDIYTVATTKVITVQGVQYRFYEGVDYCVADQTPVEEYTNNNFVGFDELFADLDLTKFVKTDRSFEYSTYTGADEIEITNGPDNIIEGDLRKFLLDTTGLFGAAGTLYVYTPADGPVPATLVELTPAAALTAAQKALFEVVLEQGYVVNESFLSVGPNGENVAFSVDDGGNDVWLFEGNEIAGAVVEANPDLFAGKVTPLAWDGLGANGLEIVGAQAAEAANKLRYTFTVTGDVDPNFEIEQVAGVDYNGNPFDSIMVIGEGENREEYMISENTKFCVITPSNIAVTANNKGYVLVDRVGEIQPAFIKGGYTFTEYTFDEIQDIELAVYQHYGVLDEEVSEYVYLFANIVPGATGTVTLVSAQHGSVTGLEVGVSKTVPVGERTYTVVPDEGYDFYVAVNGQEIQPDNNGVYKIQVLVVRDTDSPITLVCNEEEPAIGTVSAVTDNTTVIFDGVALAAAVEKIVGEYQGSVTVADGYELEAVTVTVDNAAPVDLALDAQGGFTLNVEADKNYVITATATLIPPEDDGIFYVYLEADFNAAVQREGDEIVFVYTTGENVARNVFTTELIQGPVYEQYFWNTGDQLVNDYIYQGPGIYAVQTKAAPFGPGQYLLLGEADGYAPLLNNGDILEFLNGSDELGTGAYYGSMRNGRILFFDFTVETGAAVSIQVADRIAKQIDNFIFVSYTEEEGFTVIEDVEGAEDAGDIVTDDPTAYNFLPWSLYNTNYAETVWGDSDVENDTVDTVTFRYYATEDGKYIVFVNTVAEAIGIVNE